MTDMKPSPLGHNNPPEDADPFLDRLKDDHSELLDQAADLEMERLVLPDTVEDEETAQTFTDLIGRMKKFARKAEVSRTDAKAPHLERGKKVDDFFKKAAGPAIEGANTLEKTLNVYARAKREREIAERRAREAEERAKAEAARKAEEDARRAADEARHAAEAEAARLRSAADAEERKAAEEAMRAREAEAAAARKEAEEKAKEAAKSDRMADANAKAATTGAGAKVTTGGASASVSTFWAHEIEDRASLVASLGDLGPFIEASAIDSAVARYKRKAIADGTVEALKIAGVRIFEDVQTNVRTSRKEA